MRIHHLNCVSTCPLGGALMDGKSRSLRGRLTCHCLLVETDAGLVLVDTGFGLRDVEEPRPRLSRFFLALLEPELREELTAVRQIEALGLDPHDVRHIVLTHLDFDHAGGLDDFRDAAVHVMLRERDSAAAQKTVLDRMRYRPMQWSHQHNWHVYQAGEGEAWFGFDSVRNLDGLPPEILLVPLVGHTFGHAGVAVDRGDRWLLQAGDAYFFHGEMNVERPTCTPGLRFYQWMMEKDRVSRLWNQQRLRELKRSNGGQITIFSAHDVVEFEALAARAPEVPAGEPLERGKVMLAEEERRET
jgi:glyoxylase-like metal-dependent hydrolase (beta-lactamase superfamily II)